MLPCGSGPVVEQPLIRSLAERFPTHSRVAFADVGTGAIASSLPAWFAIFTAVMDGPLDSPVCFVAPRRGDVARIAAVLFALEKFVAKQGELLRSYADATFRDGDVVRIQP